jgi:hypothetical protein
MVKTVVYNAGVFKNLKPKQAAPQFWDLPEEFNLCTWTVTAVPDGVLDGPAHPEQRVQVTDVFLLRKGPDSSGQGPNKLQLNWKVQNIGANPANGYFIISGVVIP